MIRIILSILFVAMSNFAFANGGSIDGSRFKKTGNIRLLQNADIELLEENLFIKVVDDTTYIEVHYFLKNKGKTQKVHYGFPIDLYVGGQSMDDYGVPFEVVPYHNFRKYVPYFEPYLNGEKKEIIFWKEEKSYTATIYNEASPYENNMEKNVPVDRLWYVLELDFEKDSTQELTIKYAVLNRKAGRYGGDMGFVPTTTKRYFVYDLFPSSSWSDGIVGKFSLEFDLSDLKKHDCEYKIEGLENLTKTENEIYNFAQDNFDLKKRSYISVIYDNTRRFRSRFWQKYGTGVAEIDSIASSAPNANYLIDNDPNTVWNGKEGDWIKIYTKKKFKKYPPRGQNYYIIPRGVVFLNGNYSSKEVFEESGKIKSMYMKANNIQIKEPNKFSKNDTLHIHHKLLNLPPSHYFLEGNDIYEVLESPTKYSFSYARMYNNSILSANSTTFFRVIEIKLVKSTNSTKEISISDLYVLGELMHKR